MSEAILTSQGRVTIPADLRKALGLSAGERVVFTRLDDGTTLMRSKTRSILEPLRHPTQAQHHVPD